MSQQQVAIIQACARAGAVLVSDKVLAGAILAFTLAAFTLGR